jgi:HSP20 family protein
MSRELSKDKKGTQGVEQSRQGSRRDFWPLTYSPFRMMRSFADIDRMFGGHRFSPEIEMLERDGKLLIRADLPGLTKDNVNVDVTEHSITIEGERKCEHESNEHGVYTCERSYGRFHREIPLPEGVKTDTARANFKNGTLEITMDAPQTAKNRRRIEIREEQSGKKGENAA